MIIINLAYSIYLLIYFFYVSCINKQEKNTRAISLYKINC